MVAKSQNGNLHKAKTSKNDEFYTQLSDIENEMKHYKEHFKGKTIYCNCDDPTRSNFYTYFKLNFEHLGLKKLITTHFEKNEGVKSYKLELLQYGKESIKTELVGNGDFRSEECINLLKESDIVITNPPFSLFREYIAQLMEYDKKFIILGNMNAITYKDVFKFIKENKIWMGISVNKTMEFQLSSSYEKWNRIDEKGRKFGKVPSISWFTNLEISKRHEDLILYKIYNEKEYPKYDNFNAINIDKVKEIPLDYPGYMGVPLTFLGNYNPEQFEIIDGLNRYSILDGPTEETKGKYLSQVNGNPIYIRVVIKNKKL